MSRTESTAQPHEGFSRAGRANAPPDGTPGPLRNQRDHLPATAFLKSAVPWIRIFVPIVVAAAVLLAGRSLQSDGYRLIVVHGGSMGDTIPVGSVAVAQWRSARSIEVGDIVLIQEELDGIKATPKLHRVISLDATDSAVTVETKGDANATADPEPLVISGNLLVYRYHLPHVGYWFSFVQTPTGWLFAIALPFALAAVTILVSIWRGEKRRPAGS